MTRSAELFISDFLKCNENTLFCRNLICSCYNVLFCNFLFMCNLQYSLCNEPLIELSNPGASGSVFYLTKDDEFIIKTVMHKEAEFLQKLLPGYYMVSKGCEVRTYQWEMLFMSKNDVAVKISCHHILAAGLSSCRPLQVYH